MNERIKELEKQATIVVEGWSDENGTTRYYEFNREKFAQLIIEECMRMCEVTEMGFETHGCSVEASGAITVKEYIAEHFGVGMSIEDKKTLIKELLGVKNETNQ